MSLVAALCVNPAQAAESRPELLPLTPGQWVAIDHCAAYGPDFTSVAGSDTCVRIGGRVRVEYHFHQSSDETGPSWAASRSTTMRSGVPDMPMDDMLDGIEQGHLRVRSIGVSADPLR